MKITIDPGAYVPQRAHSTDAGLDLLSPIDINILPGTREIIDTGVHVQIPDGYVGLLTSKSGLMANYGILNTGTIDSGYRGSLKTVLFNLGEDILEIRRGMKVTQLVLFPIITPEIEIVNELDGSERGNGGFGSTGV